MKKIVDIMEQKQFDDFWEIKCPKCSESIDLEILVNLLEKKSKKQKN